MTTHSNILAWKIPRTEEPGGLYSSGSKESDASFMGGAMLSKSLIQFSVDGQGCVPSLLFDLRPNYGGGNEDNGTSFKRFHAGSAALNAPDAAAGPIDPRLRRASWTVMGQSGSTSCGVTALFSWVLVHTRF